jgi:hypothetical protein
VRPLRRHEFDPAIALDRDLRIGKSRHVFRERIGEEQAPLFDQHHDRDGDDRLRHRIDAED